MAVDISIVNISGKENTREEVALYNYMLPNFKKYFEQHDEVGGQIIFYVNNLIFAGPTKDVDILMVAELDNCYVDVPNHDRVRVERLCTTIEAKSHGITGAFSQGQNIFVKYPKESPHNATEQCKHEMDLLSSFFKRVGISSWVTSLIWLYGMNEDELANMAPEAHNAIAVDSNFDRIVELICNQCWVPSNGGFLNCSKNNSSFMHDIARVFSGVKQGKSLNTIKTLNLFSKEKGESIFKDSFKGNTTILAGRAGTGKTIALLQLATYVSGERNERCLFLTYNTALVTDIKRMLNFAPYIALDNIAVFSAEKYFGDILKNNNFWTEDSNYEKSYQVSLNVCINSQTKIDYDSSYDYVFVDEAQDWTSEERDLLLRLFPQNKVIVADGIDQFVRSNNRISWGELKDIRKVSLRQKSNIVAFVNAYSNKLNLGWKVKPNPMFPGGKVNIYRSYNSKLHASYLKEAKENYCDEYDFLFLVPPSLYDSSNGFVLRQKYEERGIHIFDGTIKTNRDRGYPQTGLSLCRVYNYASCRGLEGWITVCLRFDEMVEKMSQLIPDNDHRLQALMWSLIPLTRAVDSLIITISDPDSRIGKLLKDLCDRKYATWNI